MRCRLLVEPHLSPRGVRSAGYRQLLEFTQLAEQLGYDAVFRTDHYPVATTYNSGDAWLSLAALARDTRTIRLGVMGSTITFRHAGQLAIMVAQLADIAGSDRVEVGLSIGWSEAEHAAYGIDLPPLPTRLAIYTEQIAILRGAKSTPIGETFSYSRADQDIAGIPGTGYPSLPIIVGGGGIGADVKVDLATRYADEFNFPYTSVDEVRAEFDKVAARSAAQRRNRPLRYSVSLPLCCGPTYDEIQRRSEATGRPIHVLDAIGVRGSAARCLEVLARYAAAGADLVYLQVLDMTDLSQIVYFAENVLEEAAAL